MFLDSAVRTPGGRILHSFDRFDTSKGYTLGWTLHLYTPAVLDAPLPPDVRRMVFRRAAFLDGAPLDSDALPDHERMRVCYGKVYLKTRFYEAEDEGLRAVGVDGALALQEILRLAAKKAPFRAWTRG